MDCVTCGSGQEQATRGQHLGIPIAVVQIHPSPYESNRLRTVQHAVARSNMGNLLEEVNSQSDQQSDTGILLMGSKMCPTVREAFGKLTGHTRPMTSLPCFVSSNLTRSTSPRCHGSGEVPR